MSYEYTKDNITFSICKFNREQYATSIIRLVDNNKSLSENNSFVMALDSPWGTGKSTFIKMLKNKIDAENSNIYTVIYNAWDNDYCDNPFEPLFYDIISNDLFESETDINNIKALGKSGIKIAKAFAKDMLEKASGKNTAEAADETIDNIKNFLLKKSPTIKNLAEERKAIADFKNYLSQTSELLQNKKLLIIIDELDRCKPSFAIKTLEIIKHLFDVPSIAFLLAVDFNQLSHSIATIYGQDMDSDGYLRRFVNYVLKLPEPSKNDYIDFLLEKSPLISDPSSQPVFIPYFKWMFRFGDLSLRDINSIYENFNLFFKSRFTDEMSPILSLSYLALIIIKYKDARLYNSLISGNNKSQNDRKQKIQSKFLFLTRESKDYSYINEILNLLSAITPMYEYAGVQCKTTRSGQFLVNNMSYNHGDWFGDKFLFYHDFKLYAEIGDDTLTPIQYIARQIEMFTYKDEDKNNDKLKNNLSHSLLLQTREPWP